MGTYKGGADHYHSISENISAVTRDYPLSNGLFGKRGDSKNSRIRNIVSDDPQKTAKDFYDKLGHGGIESKLYYKGGSEKGLQVKMSDGSILNWRPISSSSDGSPAVDISVETSNSHGEIVTQKIHFIRG